MKPLPESQMERKDLGIAALCADILDQKGGRLEALRAVVAMPAARSGALRAEPVALSQAEPPAATARVGE